MGRLCDKCLNYNKVYDEKEQTLDDVIIISGDKREIHHCPMYDGQIPNAIYYEEADCEWYFQK